MFKYIQNILEKVSFDKDLFKKELRKSIKHLGRKELIALRIWCLAKFGHLYQDVIVETFKNVSETFKNVS